MAEHPNSPRCHHVRTNGLRCGSPAMRNNKHCYYHRRTLGSPRNPRRAELTNLEDGNAIQLAIAHLDRRLDMGTIEYRAAHIKADLYRLALRNLRNMNPDPRNQKDVVTFDPNLEDDATSTTEPIATEPITTEPLTYDQELDLIEEGTLTARDTLTQDAHEPRSGDTTLALAVRPGKAIDYDASPVGATPLESPKDDTYLAQHAGERVASAVPPTQSARRSGSAAEPGIDEAHEPQSGDTSSSDAFPQNAHQPRSGDTRLVQDAGELGASAGLREQSARRSGSAPEPGIDDAHQPRSGDTRLALAVRPGKAIDYETSPVGATPQRASGNEKPIGKRETGNGKPSQNRETGNEERSFADLSDKEQEEMIMRLSKNDAYFLPEDTSKQPPESAADFGELVAILRKELAG